MLWVFTPTTVHKTLVYREKTTYPGETIIIYISLAIDGTFHYHEFYSLRGGGPANFPNTFKWVTDNILINILDV